MIPVRTTVTIDDSLLRKARERALRQGRPLGAIVDDALRMLFAERASEVVPVDLPVFGGSGLRPGIDLKDKDALAAVLGDDSVSNAAG